MKKIAYGTGLMITGVCGMSGIGVVSELHAAVFRDFSLWERIFETRLMLPFCLFFIFAIAGFRISTKEYVAMLDAENEAGSEDSAANGVSDNEHYEGMT